MMLFDNLLLVSAATLALSLAIGHLRGMAAPLALLYAVQLALVLAIPGTQISGFGLHILGQHVGWQLDGFGRLFAIPTLLAAVAAAWYMAGEWSERYTAGGGSLRWLHTALAANVLAMLLLLSSADLIALFIGWELVSWAGFFLMAQGGSEKALKSALRYVPYAMGGAMAIFAGLILAHAWTGTLNIDQLATRLLFLDTPRLGAILILFSLGFATKLGLLPFHLWQPAAYAECPGPGAAFLGAISSRMGLFGFGILLAKLVTLVGLERLSLWPGFLDARMVLAWVAAFTIVIPTFNALKQNDARYLLAWHGIGQGGYMLLGLVVGDALGSAGGLMHMVNYAVYQAALVLSVFAVIHRTGTADLNRLGGLITRMPLSFVTMLVGIIGLAGMPPMSGFVSKWFVYRSLIVEGMPLLFIASVIGTLGTILSVYKLIHNTFLGQLRAEHFQVKEAPWSMTLPMLALSAIVFVTGTAPGLVLAWVAEAQAALGLPVLDYTLGGVESASGNLDMLWVVGVLMAGFGIGAVLFYGAGGRAKRVHQLDNYAGGHFLTAEVRYHYSDNFYAGLMHHIGHLYRGSFARLEQGVASAVNLSAVAMQGLYRLWTPALYILVPAVLILCWLMLR